MNSIALLFVCGVALHIVYVGDLILFVLFARFCLFLAAKHCCTSIISDFCNPETFRQLNSSPELEI